ncbi:hypothetical protein Dimus_037680, partial [Dionaea muscipula]
MEADTIPLMSVLRIRFWRRSPRFHVPCTKIPSGFYCSSIGTPRSALVSTADGLTRIWWLYSRYPFSAAVVVGEDGLGMGLPLMGAGSVVEADLMSSVAVS